MLFAIGTVTTTRPTVLSASQGWSIEPALENFTVSGAGPESLSAVALTIGRFSRVLRVRRKGPGRQHGQNTGPDEARGAHRCIRYIRM